MNSFQRIVKYSAMAFAILLAVGILSGIASLVINIISGITGTTIFGNQKRIDFEADFTGVESLDLDNNAGNLNIVIGDNVRVEAEDVLESFKAEVTSDGTLKISENNKHRFLWFNFNWFGSHDSKITVYLPEGFAAKRAKLDTGAGNTRIDALKAEELIISAGAGNFTGKNLIGVDVKIDGGVGNFTLMDTTLRDADISCGVGNLRIEGALLGDTKIDCGVGEINIDINGSREDYNVDADAGVGTIRVDGEKISGSDNNREAENTLKVDGGVGKVSIDFTN